MEQIPIMRRLLDHRRMQRIARDPTLPIVTVAVDQAGEEGLRGLVARVVGGVRELVYGEGEWEEGEADVESFLEPALSIQVRVGEVAGRVFWGVRGDRASLRRGIRARVPGGGRVWERRARRRWRRASCCFRGGGIGDGGLGERTAL